MFIASVTAMAQGADKTLSGKVTDAATGEPLAGVRVEAYGNRHYTAMTDDKGEYQMKVPQWVNSVTMKVEGYNLQQTPVGKALDKVNARLYTSAFGSNYSSTTTGSVTHTANVNDNSVDMSIDPVIQQRLGADIRSISRGANPAEGNVMLMEGIHSLQSNAQPLVVIDGVLTDLQYDKGMLHSGYYNNILSNINVEDIENVTVLKNGSAIYGAKGANGVILINTKRNKSMATRIDVNIGGGFQLMPRLPKMLDNEEYRLYATEMLSDQMANVGTLSFLNSDPTYYYYPKYHNSTDWTKETYHTAWVQNYGINVQGGDDIASYNLSVGYAQSNSTLKGNDFSRFNMRLNTDIDIIRNLKVRFDAAYSDVNRDLRDDGLSSNLNEYTVTSTGILGLIKSPFLSPYAYDKTGNQSNFFEDADDYLSDVFSSSELSLANPNTILAHGDGENRNTFGNRMIVLSITPEYQFNRSLKLSEFFNFSLNNTNENYYLPMEGTPKFRILSISDTYLSNLVQSLAAREISLQSDTRLQWTHRYNAHSLNLFGGMRFISRDYKLTRQQGFNTGNDKTPNMTSSLTYKSTGGSDEKTKEITWYAQTDYNYAERYYLTAGLSMHTSSCFGDDASGLHLGGVTWGLFPNVQASWVMTNEKWLSDVPGLNYLRLNAGYDVSGNDDVNYTASRTYFIANNMLSSKVDGLSLGNIGNTELKWETTKRLSAGMEANVLNNRLSLQVDYFRSWTNNLLTLSQLAWTSGLKENWNNSGKLENEGVNVSLTGKVLNLKNFKWEMGASMGHYKNKITALPSGNSMTTSAYGATILSQVGSPVGLFYGYRTEGVFATQAAADAANLSLIDETGEPQKFKAGDMHFADVNDDHIINEKDMQVIGDPNPDVYGNIFTNMQWKNWRMEVVFNYSLGNDIYNYERSVLEGGSRFFNQTTALLNRWTTEGQVTNVPRIEYNDPMGNSRFSDRWIENGSYLRLKNVTISYTLPIQSTYLQGITFWGSAQNLFTITRYLGSDPDNAMGNNQLTLGIDRGLLGMGRSFSMGVKINL